MSKVLFTEQQIHKLSKNKNVLRVSSKSITYSGEFKKLFISEILKGKLPRIIFEENGFDVEVMGMSRIEQAADRWKKSYKNNGISGLKDARKQNSALPSKRKLSDQDKLSKLEARIKFLEAENEFFKKVRYDGNGVDIKRIKLLPSQIFELIKLIVIKHNLKNMVSYLCNVANVSRSGYYNYLNTYKVREKREKIDLESKKIILKVFNRRGFKKGSRSIKLTLENEFDTIYSLKKIRRIMKKYSIICPFRKSNPYKKIAKATKEHSTVPNRLNREFKQGVPGKVLLTDITYLTYSKGKRAYLSKIKDGSTNEILSYYVSGSLNIDIVLNTINNLIRKHKSNLTKDAFIHSDQGVHYTSPIFQKLLKKKGLGQSMSRRGNCWDNAPQESFFGHFKDEVDTSSCKSIEDIKAKVKNYITYYNNYRYQWNLKKMTPVQYKNHLLAS
ncbi:IS3 family transposase [Asaccharospora irregularis]|uniref:IS3 family transposase n=1 Tax=Asaccharospora irregularis TaxID=29359 RepID=UPI00190E9096|nr:IS3 family transposase [Asaccharospora irregularis]